ncbi:hypothetical protein BYT27DRAFT_7262812 [Phlegmacium glaucopus]|nr:hypothetical protein BYT27DRAFT_7262812 [Phlegmacium glaucopus]
MDMDGQEHEEAINPQMFETEVHADARFMAQLDDLYRQQTEGVHSDQNVEDILEEDNDADEGEESLPVPEDYMLRDHLTAWATPELDNVSEDVPQADALNNPYIRVVHRNGVHHIELVACTCRGHDTTHRGVALGTLDNLQDLRHLVHGLEVTYEAGADLSRRRAAGFFPLYDAANAKEMGATVDDPTHVHTLQKERQSKAKNN